MNTHKNANKQGEKILLGGVAAAALGLINAKPQTVKAANQNGTRATKKAASRAVKTKLTYQSKTGSETDDETADDDPAGSKTNAGTINSNPESEQSQAGINSNPASGSNQSKTIDNAKADKQEIDNVQFDSVNASRESNSSVSSIWNNIPVIFNNGILSLGEKDKTYTIDNSANNNISISQNISNVTPDDVTEIDINAPITIKGSASQLFYKLSNLNVIKNLNNLVTNDVTDMSFMFANCLKLATLDLSTFDTTNVSNFNGMFGGDTDLSSINLSSFKITDNSKMNTMFRFCSNLKKLVLGSGFKIPEIKGKPDSFLPDLGTWVNMGVDEGSPAKGTNKWSSADLMTKYQGSTDHDTYVCFANLGGTVTVHYQDEDGKQLVDQNGKQIPDEKLFGNISDPVSVDTSKEIAGYTFKENKNSDVKAFISDPQDITLVYSKSKTDNTWEGVPFTFNNGVLSLGEKGKTYTINNSDNKDISFNNNISNISGTDITEIDINAPITITGSAAQLFARLKNLANISGLKILNTSEVTSMEQMFMSCSKLTTLDLSSFETSKVTSFNTMFVNDSSLTSVNLSSFKISDNAEMMGLFLLCPNLTQIDLGKDFKFNLDSSGKPNNSLNLSGTWVNMGEGNDSLTKGTNKWSSADLMTNYQGDRDHDTYVRYTGGTVTVHRQDEDGNQLVDQDGKEIPDEKLFGNISDSVTVDTSKEFAGYKFKENKNSDVKAFTSDPQDITLVYSKSKTDNTWEGVPYAFNNGVLSLGEKGKTYTINNTAGNEIGINNISTINTDNITEIDINAPIAIKGSANGVFKNLKNITSINGLDKLDTSQVTNMQQMFASCPKLTELDLSSFNTDKVTNYNGLFLNDTNLTSINLSNFTVADDAKMVVMFRFCSNLKKLVLGSGFKFPEIKGKPGSFLPDLGTWVNMGVDQGSPAKGANQWSSTDLMTKYQGSTDHDTYVCFANLGGIVTVHRQDEDGKQLVDQDGKEIPNEKLFGNISDPVTVDTSKEFAGYTFKENKNSDVKAFISDPQDITLVYSKSKTDNTWEGVPFTFNNGVLSLGEKGKTYSIDNSAENEIGINNNISTVNTDNITEIDILGKITINGPADSLFDTLPKLTQINGLDNLITSNVTDMSYMFANCPKLVSLDLSSFDTSKVTFFSSMFYADTNLSSINLSSFIITDDAILDGLFDSCTNLTKLTLGKGVKFPLDGEQPEDLLKQPGTWVNMGEDNGSLAKGTNQWSSADLMTNYQGDRDHDTYVRYTGGIVTVHRQDEEGKQLVDQDGKEIPDEKLFGNISDSVTVDTSKEFAGYKFKENKNSDVKAFTSDPQDITLVYSKTKTDNTTISSTWEDIPVTFNNGVLSIGEKGKSYTINNSDNKDISIFNNISNVSGNDITEIDINAPIAIIGSAEILFYHLLNLTSINGLDKLDTSKVTSMLQMFMSCAKMTSLDLSSFDTTNVTNFSTMFVSDPSLTSVDLSSFTVRDDATTMGMFALSKNYTSSLTKLILGKGFKFTPRNGRPNNSLQQPGTWVNMGEGDDSLAKGTNQWSSADFMTKYQGDRDHDTYVRYTGGIVTVHRQDEEGKQLVDQDGKEIPDEKLFGNISDPVSVDTSKEFAGYKFKENKNSDVTVFTSDPQDITLVYSKTKTDNTWEGVPFTFNNGVLSLGEKGKTYPIDNSGNKEKSYALDTRDISIIQNIKGVNVDEIKEIDLNANIKIKGSANGLFKNLKNLATIKGLDNLDTSQVTNMEQMFSNCLKLTALNLSSLNTDNVTSYSSMFSGDTALTSVDLSSFKVAATAAMTDMFSSCSSLTKLTLGTGFKFTTPENQPNNSLQQSGTWVNLNEGNGSLTKGTNHWSSADFMTKYQGDRDHDTYVRYTGGTVTVHRQDEDDNQLVPDEYLFGNISDSVSVDTSKEIAGYTFKQNKNSDVTTFKSNDQSVTLIYTKSDNNNGSNSVNTGTTVTSPAAIAPAVTVHYQDEYGNTIAPDRVIQGRIGDGYTTGAETVSGYALKTRPDNATGFFSNNPQSVTYVYSKNDGNTNAATPADNTASAENEPTPIPTNNNKSKKKSTKKAIKGLHANKQSKKALAQSIKGLTANKHQANRPAKLVAAARRLNKTASANNPQKGKQDNALPKTSTEKRSSLAMLALGSLALAAALGAAWLNRKKD